jgi:AraC-like DNA-binding protein
MLSTVIFFITATLGFVCVASILREKTRHDGLLVNKYLTIIIAIQSFRLMVYGFSMANPEVNIRMFTTSLDISVVALMPCFFLYFKNLVYEDKFQAGNLLHFITPAVLVIIFLTKQLVSPSFGLDLKQLFLTASIFFYFLYAFLGLRMLLKKVWDRKSEIKAIQKQNRLIKHWTIFLYVSFLAIMIVRLTTVFFLYQDPNYNTNYLWVTALMWAAIFIKILLTPEILYGYNFLNKTINAVTEKIAVPSVWAIQGTVAEINSERDRKIKEKLTELLTEYIHKIEDLSFHSHAFRSPDLTMEDIASALNLPVSHIQYIFKFHCRESFSDYKKIVRINDATRLLEQGYLKDKTIESLSEKVGFSSYITFYLAFKSITGVTTQEYAKRFQV